MFDGVLADFNTSFIDRVVKVTGKDLFPARPFDIPCWDYPQYYGYTPKEVSAVWNDVCADKKFWQSLAPYEGVLQFLDEVRGRALAHGDDVYFITSRPGVVAKYQTERWLRSCGWSETPTVLISSEKGLSCAALNLDVYIDDKEQNVQDVVNVMAEKRKNIIPVLLDRPWNQDRRNIYPTVTKLSDFLSIIDTLRIQ